MTGRVRPSKALRRPLRTSAKRISFTVVELLILVIVVGILAMIVVSHIGASAEQSKETALKTDLATARRQIELYRTHHGGLWPHEDSTGAPDVANFVARMTGRTNQDGTLNPNGPCGPYLSAWPHNPFVPKAVSQEIHFADDENPVHNGSAGWHYNTQTGGLNAVFGQVSGELTAIEERLIRELQTTRNPVDN